LHIILVSNRLSTARTIVLTPLRVLGMLLLLSLALMSLSSLFSYLTVKYAAEIRHPMLQTLIRAVTLQENQRQEAYVKENLKVMATKLGEMQAQLTRLDSLGDRLASQTGIKTPDNKAGQSKAGQGGPLVLPSDLTSEELQRAVDALAQQVENRTDTLSLIESDIFEQRIRKNFLPTTLPINMQWNASAFGWRVDPFTGLRAMHEGVDFPSPVGTPIMAAASGIVLSAEWHPEYGNLIEIDHGNEMTTRYAHASKLLVKAGEVVKRGQRIAEVGSTGRSTGPHLHFEVRFHGIAQNPNRFLEAAQASAVASK
jgi:murein DD-endopeptidase MepM/ murein hydrolase activator NlpD